MGIKSRPPIPLILLLSIFLLSLAPSQVASNPPPRFNIFQYLSAYPQYSDFLELLNRTRLAQDISTREQITVLVVKNENLGDVIPKQKLDVLQPMLCAHVLLEFIDSFMLQGNRVTFPHEAVTVYQTTGVADDLQGRVRIYRTPEAYYIGSAIKGVKPNVKFVSTVREQKFKYSVMEVTGFIVTPGISDEILPPPAPPLPAPTPRNATKEEAEEDVAADAPADSPEDSDSSADSPAEDSPADSPADPPAADSGKVADKGDDKPAWADDSAPSPSSAGRLMSSLFGGAFIGGLLAAATL